MRPLHYELHICVFTESNIYKKPTLILVSFASHLQISNLLAEEICPEAAPAVIEKKKINEKKSDDDDVDVNGTIWVLLENSNRHNLHKIIKLSGYSHLQ